MGLLSLVLIVVALWLVLTGRIQRLTGKDGVMLGLAIVGALLAAKGQPLIGGVPLLLSSLYAARRFWPLRGGQPAAPPSYPHSRESMDIGEARRLLGVERDADADAIRTAHRRLIAKIHPDAGGTQALAEKINEARTILLRHITDTNGPHPPSQPPTGSQ